MGGEVIGITALLRKWKLSGVASVGVSLMKPRSMLLENLVRVRLFVITLNIEFYLVTDLVK